MSTSIYDGPVSNSKAIMGAIFIQYIAYGIIYVMEGSKYAELHVPTPAAAAPQPPKQPEPQVDADGNPVDAGDIDLQIDG